MLHSSRCAGLACGPLLALTACGSPGGGTTETATDTVQITSLDLTSTSGDTTVTTGTTEPEPTGPHTDSTVGQSGTGTTTDATVTGDTGTTADVTTEAVQTTAESDTAPDCAMGEVVCEGMEAKVCDGNGGFSETETCEAVCQPGVGCLECEPGAFFCENDVSMHCSDDGMTKEVNEACDPLQGISCNADVGLCDGECAVENLQLNYIGCDYYPTVTLQHDQYNAGTKVFAAVVANTSGMPATLTVSKGDMMVKQETVEPNSVKIVTLPWVADLTKGSGPSKLVTDGAYRLRSDHPVTVYQYNLMYASATNDASLLLPVNAWTGSYVVASFAHASTLDYPGFYAVVASQDDTQVTLAPSATGTMVQAGGGVAADGTGVVTLDAGDVLQVATAAGGDLTGTRVEADKPVQVIGGHKCTNVPSNLDACDHLEESMFPVEALATEYIVVPSGNAPDGKTDYGQVVRVIATEPATKLTFTPDQAVAKDLANPGDFVELGPTSARFKVASDKKILVVQYMVGQAANFGEADPSMLLAVATEQYRKDYLLHAPPSWETNFVDIILKNGTAVQVDGKNVPGAQPIGATGYSLLRVLLDAGPNADGNHTILGTDRVGISVYGLQDFGSYWVVGGLDLDHL